MSHNSIARPQSAASVHPGFGHDAKQPSGEEKPVFTRAKPEAARNRDAGQIASRIAREFANSAERRFAARTAQPVVIVPVPARSPQGSDDVFYPANASMPYEPPVDVHIGARVPPVVNGQVLTIAPHVRERALLGMPATLQYIRPYEVPGQVLNGQNGRVFVSPMRAIEHRLPPGTIVTTTMDPEASYL